MSGPRGASDGRMPGWLTDHLIARGVMTERRLTITARPYRCTRCGVLTLAALDAEVCAFETFLDPAPTTTAGEAFGLLTGRRSYVVTWTHRLQARDAAYIRAVPADAAPKVHVTHECNAPPLPIHPAFIARGQKGSFSEKPPF